MNGRWHQGLKNLDYRLNRVRSRESPHPEQPDHQAPIVEETCIEHRIQIYLCY